MNYFLIDRLIDYVKSNWIPITLVTLSIYDLRIDLRILIDFFTFSSFLYTLFEHPLPFTVLLISPALFKSFRKK